MAGALVVSGGRFFIHAGGPALPVATLTSDDLRGDVTIQGSRARRDLFNGVRAVYVEPSANWQPTDAPPLQASNYVAEDGGEADHAHLRISDRRTDADGLPPIEVRIVHRRAGVPPLGRPVPLHCGDGSQHVARDVLADISCPIEHPHEQPPA